MIPGVTNAMIAWRMNDHAVADQLNKQVLSLVPTSRSMKRNISGVRVLCTNLSFGIEINRHLTSRGAQSHRHQTLVQASSAFTYVCCPAILV